MNAFRYGLCIALVTLLSACDGIPPTSILPTDSSDSTASDNPGAIVLAANAKLVRADEGIAITSVEDDALTLAVSPGQAVPVPGQIIVSLEGEWIIRRIVGLEDRGAGLFEMQTEPASLEEAFVELHLEGSTDLRAHHAAASESKSQDEALAINGSTGLSFSRSFNGTITGASGPRFSYGLTANGGLTVQVSIDISGSTLRSARFDVRGTAGLQVIGNLDAPAGTTLSKESRLTPNGVLIGTIPTNIPGVSIPVYFNAYAGLSVTSGTRATVRVEAGANGSMTASVQKSNGAWSPTFSKSFAPSLKMEAQVPGSVSGEIYARARISAFSSNGNGPWVDLKLPKVSLSAQQVSNGRYRLCLAPKVSLGVGFSLPASYAGIPMPCSNCWSYTFPDQSLSTNPLCWNF